ncbi:MAG: L,D-transpeptidase family protein [Methylococcaceae bacterium]|jgi:L,D-transpeptidase ErfK/SrfK
MLITGKYPNTHSLLYFSSLAKTLLFPLIVATLLTGCQNLPLFSDEELPPVTSAIPEQLETLESHHFQLSPQQNIIGKLAIVDSQAHDNLPDIARHFGLGYNDITRANPVIDPWLPAAKQHILLPLQFILPDAPHSGIVLNLANMRLFYYPEKTTNSVLTYPVGIGRQGWNTPVGLTQIIAKKNKPQWIVPDSILREHAEKNDPLPKVVPTGPDNPLGEYAMPLGFPGYLIHGTNKPYGIGMQISHGCIQLYPEDIEQLFKKSSVGMPVRIVHQPYLTAWQGNMLYLEAHPPLEKWESQKNQLKTALLKNLKRLSAVKQIHIDWEKVDSIVARADGVPTPILSNSPGIAEIIANAIVLKHPQQWYGQLNVAAIGKHDLAILAASFNQASDAHKFTAMLNHQGPPIPARTIVNNDQFWVVAGPFKSVNDANSAIHRIKINFEMDAKPLSTNNIQISTLE